MTALIVDLIDLLWVVYVYGYIAAVVILLYWQHITGRGIKQHPEARFTIVAVVMVMSLLSWATVWVVFHEEIDCHST